MFRPNPAAVARAMLHLLAELPVARPAPVVTPPGGSFVGTTGTSRPHTKSDARAFANRVARRRAKKGYR